MPSDEFFVGYLPTPVKQRRFLLIAVVLLLLTASALAAIVASLQHDPGEGIWNMDQVVQFDGVLRAIPYPFIETSELSILLVSEGKVGADDRVRQFDGHSVRVKGYLIERKGLSILELQSAADFLRANEQNPAPQSPLAASKLVTVQLRGEIIDSKCFLGAMKPGDGKPHKACAALCIRGGIPPMLVSFDSSGQRTDYLLVDSSGNALSGNALEAVIPFVGESIEIIGEAQQRGSLKFLRIQPVGAVHRL